MSIVNDHLRTNKGGSRTRVYLGCATYVRLSPVKVRLRIGERDRNAERTYLYKTTAVNGVKIASCIERDSTLQYVIDSTIRDSSRVTLRFNSFRKLPNLITIVITSCLLL